MKVRKLEKQTFEKALNKLYSISEKLTEFKDFENPPGGSWGEKEDLSSYVLKDNELENITNILNTSDCLLLTVETQYKNFQNERVTYSIENMRYGERVLSFSENQLTDYGEDKIIDVLSGKRNREKARIFDVSIASPNKYELNNKLDLDYVA